MSLRRRLAGLPRRLESRFANPVVARVLASPFHPLLSRWLLLLSYEGRRSGRRYTTPTMYRRTPDGVVLFTPAEATNWWRNFRGGYSLTVLLRGEWRRGEGEVVSDESAVLDHLRWLAWPLRRVGRFVGATASIDERLERAAPSFVLVRVTFDESPETDRGDVEGDRRER